MKSNIEGHIDVKKYLYFKILILNKIFYIKNENQYLIIKYTIIFYKWFKL